MAITQPNLTDSLTLTPEAKARLLLMLRQEMDHKAKFRISITGGGCSGFQYNFSFDSEEHEDDLIINFNDVSLIVDQTSFELIKGCEIDFVENLSSSSFKIKNPNAATSCGCGHSFSL
ncbi:MAG: iron-sulfur cluster insertion protein ErpA [Alphaproteobacteria bacterium]|nr:iron-sulfur cluster insertion protein ErpA [Alphaproteobacteria bacterium]